MKKFYITLFMAFTALSLMAQNNPVAPKGFMGANPANLAPKFTEEQKTAMKSLRFEIEKEMLQIHNQLGEKKAQLRTLQQVDKPDMKSINSKIDEITALQNKAMKLKAANHAKVRALLTDEQRLEFDKRMGQKREGKRVHMQRDNRPGFAAPGAHAMVMQMRNGQGFRGMQIQPGKEGEVKIMRFERKVENETKKD